MNTPLIPNLIFEDTHLIVVSKPSGLLSQGEHTGDFSLVDWAREHFGRHYVGLIHRLDRNTSGLMVIAKRTKSAQRLTQSLQDGSLVRKYQAWVWGSLTQNQKWTHWLTKNEKTNEVSASRTARAGAKEAQLNVEMIRAEVRHSQPITLAEYTLQTGRSHQIRVQSAIEGHPLLGDSKYGSRESIRLSEALAFSPNRLALHSCHLSFPHPMGGEMLTFSEAMPALF